MLIVKYDRYDVVTKLANSDNYAYLVDVLNGLTEELESENIFLIRENVYDNLTRILEFASIENGWECVIAIAHGYVKSINGKI